MGTSLNFSSSFGSQTDGQSEIAFSIVLDLLKCYVHDHKEKWEDYLPLVEYAYNNTIHTSTERHRSRLWKAERKCLLFWTRRIRSLSLPSMMKIGSNPMWRWSMLFKGRMKSKRKQRISIADLWSLLGWLGLAEVWKGKVKEDERTWASFSRVKHALLWAEWSLISSQTSK